MMAAILLTLSGCAAEQKPVEASLFAMNTYMTFTAYGENAQSALDESTELIETAESLWSVTDQASEIHQANHSGGQPVSVSEETAALISFALEMAKQTNGALDPTIYPVLMAWGFTTNSKQVPSQQQIDTLLEQVDYTKIQLDGTTLTVPEGMQLDLGAVGKGYTADLVAEVLRKHGITSALISLGGNIHAIGSKPDGSDWRIGIRAPWESGNLGILKISDAAVVTSGGYENYFEDDAGNVYWHILNPATGYPADSGVQSMLIVGPEGKRCDALSTALFVMGPEEAEAYWRKNGGFEMLMVTDEHEILLTEGIARRFTLNEGRSETVRVLKS
ncbi:MAG: FAD:protein FMN transferase [Acutalibacteraceae bacterium]|nr:FAD:protein FMN transferase [Acutalibacteraceae bacterium]HIR04257.1 FAD:protein FMN transferase [Candidatus Scatovicinus merdipullorum]